MEQDVFLWFVVGLANENKLIVVHHVIEPTDEITTSEEAIQFTRGDIADIPSDRKLVTIALRQSNIPGDIQQEIRTAFLSLGLPADGMEEQVRTFGKKTMEILLDAGQTRH